MDENQLLQQLALEAQSYPDQSAKRRIALNKLFVAIYRSPSLRKPVYDPKNKNYRDNYDEALGITCAEIHRRIDSYKPERPFMAWVNFILDCRIKDVKARDIKKGLSNIPGDKDKKPRWWNIDANTSTEEGESSSDAWETKLPSSQREQDRRTFFKAFIADDPDGRFSERHILNLPNATFKNICLMIFEDQTWQEIAEYFETSISTASSFYRREVALLREYLQRSFGLD